MVKINLESLQEHLFLISIQLLVLIKHTHVFTDRVQNPVSGHSALLYLNYDD